jgi:hypothetical protein
MKTIEPVMVWFNGQEIQATVLKAIVSNDDLLNTATFQYQLMRENAVHEYYSYLENVVQGFLTITGEDYIAWDTNDYAYNWIAKQLNLVITGEYVPPTPVVPTTPVPPVVTV